MRQSGHEQESSAYRWIILASVFMIVFMTVGTRSTLGVFFKAIIEDLGWNRGTISMAVAISIWLSGGLTPFAGYVMDRFGAKWLFTISVAVFGSVFVRTASFSGRMDLTDDLVALLQEVARRSQRRGQPFVTVFFGNPYAATFLPELPAILLTYDYYDLAEASAVRALAGEAPISGRLPIALGDQFPVGHGLTREASQ